MRFDPDGRGQVPAAPPTSFAALHTPASAKKSELPPMMSFWPPLPKMTLFPPPPSMYESPSVGRSTDAFMSRALFASRQAPTRQSTLVWPGWPPVVHDAALPYAVAPVVLTYGWLT